MVSSRRRTTVVLAVISIILSLLVLNRWIVAGYSSDHQLWQLFINYFEVGFVRRSLVGTLLSLSELHSLFDNGYTFSYFVQGTAILILVFLVFLHVLRNDDNIDTILKVMVFLSPAFIIQSGYLIGSLDIFVLLVAAITILFVRNRYLFSMLLIAGVLIHELYIFTVPAQMLAFYWKTNGSDGFDIKRFIAAFQLPVLCFVTALILILLFGRLGISADEYRAIMEQPHQQATGRADWDWQGYFQLSSSFEENAKYLSAARYLSIYKYIRAYLWFLLLLLCYLVVLGVILASNIDIWRLRLFFIVAGLFPLFTSFVALDIWRWIGMSANMSILLLLLISTDRQVHISRLAYPVILLFTALAPFGSSQMGRPFPMHQFIIERLAL